MSLEITGTYHSLPLEKLSPQEFERLCLWLVRREGYADVEYLGASGSEQGRDLLARLEGKSIAFQCKRVASFQPRDVTSELTKLLQLDSRQKPDEIIFIVTCAASATTRNVAKDLWGNDATCSFWAGAELDERIKRYPEILREFFQLPGDLHAGPSKSNSPNPQELTEYLRALMEFCGQVPYASFPIASTPLLSSIYIEQDIENVQSREKFKPNELLSRETFLLLQGIPGIGKSSFLYYNATQLARRRLDSNVAEPGSFPVVVSARTLAAERGSFADSLRAAVTAELGYLLPHSWGKDFGRKGDPRSARQILGAEGASRCQAVRSMSASCSRPRNEGL